MVKKIWWKEEGFRIPIKGFKSDWNTGSYDRRGLAIYVEDKRNSETPKTIKLELQGMIIDQEGDEFIDNAKTKIIMLNSKTTKAAYVKIIQNYYEYIRKKANKMDAF